MVNNKLKVGLGLLTVLATPIAVNVVAGSEVHAAEQKTAVVEKSVTAEKTAAESKQNIAEKPAAENKQNVANKEVGNWKYYNENGNLLGEAPYEQIPKAIRDAKEKNIEQFWKDIKSGK